MLRVGTSGDPALDHRDDYAFNASTGRLSTVTRHYPGGSVAFAYDYLAGTDLVDAISAGSYQRNVGWQGFRDLEDVVETKWGSMVMARYVYAGTDLEARRTAANLTGELPKKFSYTNGYQTTWSYTDRSELDLSESRQLDSSGNPTGAWITAWKRDWSWDSFANRTYEDRDGSADTTYTPNALNQYGSITGHQAEPNLAHDLDGNLVQDGTWNYRYDGTRTYDGDGTRQRGDGHGLCFRRSKLARVWSP